MIYIIRRDDNIVSVLEGPDGTNLLTMETQWIESMVKPALTVEISDPVAGSTCTIDPFQQAKAAHTWEEFEQHLVKNCSFTVRKFTEYDTLMRMNKNGPRQSRTGDGHVASNVDAALPKP